jgi:branched-chain amino acid transport system ATP-binding protein
MEGSRNGGVHESLIASAIGVQFEGLRAVDDVDLILRRGEILGLIGPNGAGKTTLVNVLSGFQRPSSGRVTLPDGDVTGWPPQRIARAGVGRTFQNVRLFPALTVLENVEAGAVRGALSRHAARREALALLEFASLDHRAGVEARSLSHGEERMVGILRALATRPSFLLLDEPAAGLNESESGSLVEMLRSIRETFKLGMLVIEHDMTVIMRLCESIQVLDHGKTIALGTPSEIRRDPEVRRAYLGTADEASC